jgi:hypothetical protein
VVTILTCGATLSQMESDVAALGGLVAQVVAPRVQEGAVEGVEGAAVTEAEGDSTTESADEAAPSEGAAGSDS